ncbi:MAG TPA: hypothetical protein VFW63_00175 [Acidimicrobiales bacterium]|nr:hypothetical protein [Acidimicrobiales bacterium]
MVAEGPGARRVVPGGSPSPVTPPRGGGSDRGADDPTVPVVVAGAIASKLHNGGEAWVRMSWLRAVAAAGHDAWLIEQIDDPAPEQVAYFAAVAHSFGATGRALLVDGSARVVVGPGGVDARDVADAADVLLNISGHLSGPSLFERFDRRVLVDIDPGYTQAWHAQGLAGAHVEGHHAFATIGENIGADDCAVPTCGLTWIPTRQPVAVDDWAAPPPPGPVRFTTVAAWRGSYGPLSLDGVTYGVKAHEFRRIRELPARCPQAGFEIALDIHPGDAADRDALLAAGWALADPAAASATPGRFRDYVRASGAELSVAQGVYVATNSGWFSDRTARYLAAGRPAVVQDTGFSRNLPCGRGLLPFDGVDDAADAVAAVVDDYDGHAAAARALAAAHLDPVAIVDRLLADTR